MANKGHVIIRVDGNIGNKKISPRELDISEIQEVLFEFETFLFANEIKERPLVSYEIDDGSVLHKFFLPVSFVIIFNALTNEISKKKSVDFLEFKQSKAIEYFQRKAKEKDWKFSFDTSLDVPNELVIDKTTNYYKSEPVWIDTELYLYGDIFDVGGLKNPNIHIDTKEYGSLIVETSKSKLLEDGSNLLYKTFGLRVHAKQNTDDGSIKDLKLIDYTKFSSDLDKNEFDKKVSIASKNLSKIKNPEKWIRELRGSIE